MPLKPFKRKVLKITAYFLGSIIVLLIGFHFWFINHVEGLIEEMVEARSNGKLKLEVRKFKFNWFSNHMQLRDAVFYSTDTATNPTSYRFSVQRIDVTVKEILPLIFEKKILFDSLALINPDIRVTRLRPGRSNASADTTNNEGASLPHEMGKVYNSIQDALQVLNVTNFKIENGKFTLINKIRPDELPVTISNLAIHLDNLKVDTNKQTGKQKILFSDNVSIQTHDQDIFFPDGRHRLTFSNFRINILKRMVEFDSCTIAASKGDSTRNSFSVFFDKLRLTNIDFDTLYQKEVIKADSVYCINPIFKLDVEMGKRTGKRKSPPKLNELIQQLTGDLQLAFVVVENAAFDINTVRDDKPSSFTSDHNNFELQGLRIQQNSSHPLTVKSFAMAIRNYENFLRDSTYAMQFDSILLINNSIYLNNFSVTELDNDKVINSFSMPRFELKGLSWDDLVFERKLSAARATLYSPVINYSFAQNKRQKKQDVFQTLAGIGNIIQLNNLNISNGQINVHFKGGGQLQLENASVSLLSQNFVHSRRIDNLQRSVSNLHFKKGFLQLGNLLAKMEDVDFTGKDGALRAGTLYLANKEKTLSVIGKNVVIDKMMIDNNSSITDINGLRWQEADIRITDMRSSSKDIAPNFVLKNIKGTNTKLTASDGNQKLSAFLEEISADEIVPKKGNKPDIKNPAATGKDFSFINNKLSLVAARFRLKDHSPSEMSDIRFTNNLQGDSTSVVIPFASFTPDISSILNGSIVTDDVTLTQPMITLKRESNDNSDVGKRKRLPLISVNKITVLQPDIYLSQHGYGGITKIEWKGKEGRDNSFELTNLKSNPESGISIAQFLLSLQNFDFTSNGKTFNSGKASINTRINNFFLKRGDADEWDWYGNISNLKAANFIFDSIGKQNARFEIKSGKINNLDFSSTSIVKLRQLVKESANFRATEITGRYDDAKDHFDWLNAAYDKSTKTLSLDSFSYHPIADKETFISNHPYQIDYVTLQTGAIKASGVNIDSYLNDSVLNAGTVGISNAGMKFFRDKRKPFGDKDPKPMPVDILKKLPFKLSVNTIDINNTDIEYAELNEKTNQTGTVILSRVKGKILSARNYNTGNNDSLDITAEGWLMDSARIRLHVKESYIDPRAGFLLHADLKTMDARLLNPLLIPLASVRLESGILDTIYLDVKGDDYLAIGEMKMLYHALKIKILNNNRDKKKPTRNFASFLVNTFFIKNNNRSRTNGIYFERVREKSFINYLVKITLNGVTSSIGIKNNKKALRKYKKELKKRNL